VMTTGRELPVPLVVTFIWKQVIRGSGGTDKGVGFEGPARQARGPIQQTVG
jgi:hypothetical protein